MDSDPIEQKEQKLLLRELKDPQQQLNVVFLLIGVIPILACVYAVLVPTLGQKWTFPELTPILLFANLIMVLGYLVGYRLIRNILRKALIYAMRAKRSEQMRVQLASALAHDLKSPLAIIKANLANLRAGTLGPLDPRQKEMADLCSGVADRTAVILMDLIKTYSPVDYAREPEVSRFDLCAVAQEQLREIQAVAKTKSLEVKSSFPRLPLLIDADRPLIVRAVHNLLSNAIKYTPSHGEISLKILGIEGFAQLEVANTGNLIPEKALEMIFESYERLDRSAEGEGLGLAITRAIAEAHHGKVWAESAAGQSNRFILLLPLAGGV
jgi:signal transduction histidine kinase